MNFFEKILYALQYEIERPHSYGVFHIVCLIISILLTIYLVKRKEKDHQKSLKHILLVYGIVALVLEITKQIIWSFNYDPTTGSILWDYQWYAFPFQLCTTPIFASLIAAFTKNKKLKNNLLSFMAFTTILGSLATAIYPETCFVRTLLIDIHTMYLHFGSLIVSIYILAKRDVPVKWDNLIDGYRTFLTFALIAEIMNIVIYNVGILHGETFNMFYISPYFISGLPLYDVVQKNTTFIIFIMFYLVTIFIGSLIVYYVSKILIKDKKKK